jgi:hypothetical protein
MQSLPLFTAIRTSRDFSSVRLFPNEEDTGFSLFRLSPFVPIRADEPAV